MRVALSTCPCLRAWTLCDQYSEEDADPQAEGSRDAKEIAAILAEENVELLPEEDKEKLQELDSLTGQPRATDILLYAIPVSTLQQAVDLKDLSGGWECLSEAQKSVCSDDAQSCLGEH